MSIPNRHPSANADVLASGIDELLHAAAGTVSDLLDRCPPDDPLEAQLRQVHQTLQRLTGMTGQLNRIGRRKPAPGTALDLNTVVRQLAPALQRLLGPFISLNTSLHPPGLWIQGDRGQIEQAVLGLVINAREALPLGGVVRLSTRSLVLDATREYRVGELLPGDWVILEVRDNGTGIDERTVEHLLEPSQRGLPLDAGLSLSTVTSIVRQADGQVILDTTRDGGTMLAACFPAVPRPTVPHAAVGTAVAVLVADDDDWIRLSTARALRRAGFGVLEAEHGDAALELLNDVAGSCVRLVITAARLRCSGSRPLADRLRDEHPELDLVTIHPPASFTARRHHDVRLEQPFSPDGLVRLVRSRIPETV